MKPECPNSLCKSDNIVRKGFFFRKSDSKYIRRFLCRSCNQHFSSASNKPTFGQKRRRLNPIIYKLLCSGTSQRRIAILLGCNLKTVARKLIFLSSYLNYQQSLEFKSIGSFQFDEMETWIHTKYKPASIFLAVEKHSRKILNLQVCQMPSKGLLKSRSLKKYGRIFDERPFLLKKAFTDLHKKISPHVLIESDSSPRYPKWVQEYFPHSEYNQFKGKRGCVIGQGELKEGKWDPLFSLNHTAAMLRANINRLFRKTWCTSKKMDRLQMHLNIYAHYHNEVLT